MSIKKFQVRGIILIDCWGGDWISKWPRYAIFNKQLEEFISTRVEYQYIISSSEGLDENLRALPGTHVVCKNWKDLEDYLKSESVTGNWLIGGQSWQVCFHHSEIGPKTLQSKDYNNFLMFSHPELVYSEFPDQPITDYHFETDPIISWTKSWAPMGTDFWLIDGLVSRNRTYI